MSDTNDGTTTEGTPEGQDTQPDQKGSPEADPIALARRRQAGAEAARAKAEEARDAAMAELEKYRSAERSQADKDLADMSKLQERLDFEKRRADEAEARAEARILDLKYPNARAELPEITDEIRLAKLEALLADTETDGEKEPPTPRNPNDNRSASGDATSRKPAEETSEDILARLKQMGRPDWL